MIGHMNLIEEHETGLLTYQEFQSYIWGCGQRLINYVGLDKCIFYLMLRRANIMNKNSYVGVVDKIRVIEMFPDTKVRFTLHTPCNNVNYLIMKKRASKPYSIFRRKEI